jgi:hypothetical protein
VAEDQRLACSVGQFSMISSGRYPADWLLQLRILYGRIELFGTGRVHGAMFKLDDD